MQETKYDTETKIDEARAQARMAHFSKGIQTVSHLDEQTIKELSQLAETDKGIRELNEALSKASTRYFELARLIEAGELSRDKAKVELGKVFHPLQDDRLIDIRRKIESKLPARPRDFEPMAMHALFDDEQLRDSHGWHIEGDGLGSFFFKPRHISRMRRPIDDLSGNPFVELPDEPFGPDEPPAPMPFIDCQPSPFSFQRVVATNVGLGIGDRSATTDAFRGSVYCRGHSQVFVAGGAATYCEALVGRDVQWPVGFSTLRVSATVRVVGGLRAMALLAVGGCGAGADIVLDVTLDNGDTFRRLLPLGAVVAAVFSWEFYDVNDTYGITLYIPIPPRAGSARLLAGISGHTASGGVSTAGASVFLDGTVTRLCTSLS